jgi:hypothetical protein
MRSSNGCIDDDPPLVHQDDDFKRWWAVTQCTVWSLGIVVVPPSFDNDLGFLL